MSASRNADNGLNADSSRLTVTNSIEPAKMKNAMHTGHSRPKPFACMSSPYDPPRKKNPAAIGRVSGRAALNALALMPCSCGSDCPCMPLSPIRLAFRR